MSIFDRLGLVCLTTTKGRLRVQDIWQIKISWDAVVPQDLCEVLSQDLCEKVARTARGGKKPSIFQMVLFHQIEA